MKAQIFFGQSREARPFGFGLLFKTYAHYSGLKRDQKETHRFVLLFVPLEAPLDFQLRMGFLPPFPACKVSGACDCSLERAYPVTWGHGKTLNHKLFAGIAQGFRKFGSF